MTDSMEQENGYDYSSSVLSTNLIEFGEPRGKGNPNLRNLFEMVDYNHVPFEEGRFQFPVNGEMISHDSKLFGRRITQATRDYRQTTDAYSPQEESDIRQQVLNETPFSQLVLLTAVGKPSLTESGVTETELRRALTQGALEKEMELRKLRIRATYSAGDAYAKTLSVDDLTRNITALQSFQNRLGEGISVRDYSQARRK